ncbi:MAG: hypothetical protein NVS3B21_34070 [Acidimicrobiales bacterium]
MMAATAEELLNAIDAANADMLAGNPDPWKALLRPDDHTTLLGAFGGSVQGWSDVSARFERTAATYGGGGRTCRENIACWIGADLACTVDLEHHEWSDPGAGTTAFTYRTTHVLQRGEDGWKIVLRHADPLAAFTGPTFAHTQPNVQAS